MCDPSLLSTDFLNFRPLIKSIKNGTFMNIYNIFTHHDLSPSPGEEKEKKKKDKEDKKRQRPGDKEKKNNKKQTPEAVRNEFVSDTQTETNISFFRLHKANLALRGTDDYVCPTVNGAEMCLKFHLNGQCTRDCERRASHVRVSGAKKDSFITFRKKLETKAKATQDESR